MEDINQHINKDKELLDDATLSPQMRRHIEAQLTSLERYREEHPEDSHDPTDLELYCNENPDANECRIYED